MMRARPGPAPQSQIRFPANDRELESPSRRHGAVVTFARHHRLQAGCFILLLIGILFWLAVVEANKIRPEDVALFSFWDVTVLVGANLVGSLFLFLIVFGFLQYLKDTHREELLVRTVVEPLKR